MVIFHSYVKLPEGNQRKQFGHLGIVYAVDYPKPTNRRDVAMRSQQNVREYDQYLYIIRYIHNKLP